MEQHAFKAEEVWLRTYLETWPNEVFFSIEAEQSMVANRVFMPAVMELLRTAPVVESEKLEVGAQIVVEGRTCNEDIVQVVCHIDCNCIQVGVVNVLKM